MINSIQSMPRVAATPKAAAIAVPIRAATIPTRSVSHSGIFCRPGATIRPRTPIINPITKAVMIPVISTVDLHQFRCISIMRQLATLSNTQCIGRPLLARSGLSLLLEGASDDDQDQAHRHPDDQRDQ